MRFDLDVIQGFIQSGSYVLDLGCGDGELLKQLSERKAVHAVGIENDADKIQACIEKNISVVERDIDYDLSDFKDNSYDTVIMTLTLQAIKYPDKVLEEMLRIGRECIVTFPNFGHWKARWHLSLHGKMPVSDLLPYEWYDTPNIHFCTVKDFEVLCRQRKINVLNRKVVAPHSSAQFLCDLHPNLFGETAIYHLSR